MTVNEILKNIDFKLVLIVLSIIVLLLKKYEDYKMNISITKDIDNKNSISSSSDSEEETEAIKDNSDLVYLKKVHRMKIFVRGITVLIGVCILVYIIFFE